MPETVQKTALSKAQAKWYKALPVPEVIHFDNAGYLAIEGKGDPSGIGYAENLGALYAVAYALKFYYKSRQADFVVPKLEGQWWFDTEKFGEIPMDEAPLRIPRSEWNYRSLIRLPEFVDSELIPEIQTAVKKKKDLPLSDLVHFYELPESYFIQILHIGPFENEPASLLKLKEFSDLKGFEKNGLHHEIYLSDFRKIKSSNGGSFREKLKTILREPVK